MKKIISLCLTTILVLSFAGCSNKTPVNSTGVEDRVDTIVESKNDDLLEELPLPELEEGMRGQLGIDKNINEATIDKYLHRSDAVYRDVRMLIDEGNYEAIGGDSYLSGYVDGFEVVPLPYLCNVMGLPPEVGQTYSGTTLFTVDENGNYTANYKESEKILNDLFPRDKVIFLMCGGGGYAGMTKNLLVANGWDADKIYDVGGYWYYEGENSVEVKRVMGDETYYDFYKVRYHNIDFSELHLINNDGEVEEKEITQTIDENLKLDDVQATAMEFVDVSGLNARISSGDTFILYVYLPGCTSCAGFKPILDEFIESHQVATYQIPYTILKESEHQLTTYTKYTPAVFIFKDKNLIAYLNPASDKDLHFYESTEEFSKWVSTFLGTEVIESETINENVGCEDECTD